MRVPSKILSSGKKNIYSTNINAPDALFLYDLLFVFANVFIGN